MSLARNIRIHYECRDGIEKSVPRITNWHCEACLTNMVAKMATASMRRSRGGWGSGHHLKNHKVVGLLNNKVRIRWKIIKKQASIRYWAISYPPAKRHLNGVSLAGRWWPILVVFGFTLPSSIKKERTKQNKNVRVGSPLTKLSWSAHGLWWLLHRLISNLLQISIMHYFSRFFAQDQIWVVWQMFTKMAACP